MAAPVMAIVGRPNVGKSTLFNKIIGQRMAIVEDRPGITRDRIYAPSEWSGVSFRVIDTGGLELGETDPLTAHIRAQVELAVDEAQVIVFLTDGECGITGADEDIADRLRRSGKPVIVAVNKLDNPGRLSQAYEFFRLGFAETVGISAEHGIGTGDLLDAVIKQFPDDQGEPEYPEDSIKIAIIGRPNVGKSSLVNKLLGEERVLVSDVAGTTRDAIDTELVFHDQPFVLMDTAGVRKRGKVYERTEKYSVLRALRAIERSDVAVLIIDASQGIIEQDKHVAGYALDAGKAIMIAVNKWDLVEKDGKTAQEFEKRIRSHFPFMSYAPIVFISASTGQRVTRVLEVAAEAAESHALRIATSTVNTIVQEAVALVPPPTDKGRRLKVLYATQVAVKPPTFAVFVNNPEMMHFSYSRYLENKLREAFGFHGTPIRILVRGRSGDR
ncbi:MAG: ribosome biogenesis GTPase Der [Firmicutes bacterium]|nr:ribosome biogenesis GTPase Der [Bacillota bacterium]